MKKHLPNSWKLQFRRTQRAVRDWRSGASARFPKKEKKGKNLPIQFSLTQPIRRGKNYSNKVQNLRLAAASIQDVAIAPSEVFSFWHFVGNPSKKNGFLPSRNLVNGRLVPQYGGGLCQISGIIYHLALLAELPILERYRHSVDIYEEHERFTPPGSDATVVFGRKDLRFENHFDCPVSFRFSIENETLTAHFCASEKVEPADIQFVVSGDLDATHVEVMRANEMLYAETYPKLKPA